MRKLCFFLLLLAGCGAPAPALTGGASEPGLHAPPPIEKGSTSKPPEATGGKKDPMVSDGPPLTGKEARDEQTDRDKKEKLPGKGPTGGALTPAASTTPAGHLPPEAIQKVMRQSFSSIKACYEQGLTRDPTLRGSMRIRFVIGKDGRVRDVSEEGAGVSSPLSDPLAGPRSNAGQMPDKDVTACVMATVERLAFPPPDGGVVAVVYPIVLSPGD